MKSRANIRVVNGIVVFKNLGQYLKTIKLLSHYSNNEIFAWAKSAGFESYNKKAEEAIDNLDKVNSESELNIVMKDFQDFLTMHKDKAGEYDIDLTVEPNIFTNVANKDGLFIIGNEANRILGNYILKTNVDEMDKLLSVHYKDIKNNSIPREIKLIKYINTTTFTFNQNKRPLIEAGDGTGGGNTSQTYQSTKTATNQTSNRKVELFAYAIGTGNYSGNYATYDGYILAIAKKRILGIFWVNYKTEIDIEGTNDYGDDYIIETPWGIKSYNIPHLVSPTDMSNYYLPAPDYGFGSQIWQPYPGPEMYLISVHLKAWTRGTTQNVFADIEYDL